MHVPSAIQDIAFDEWLDLAEAREEGESEGENDFQENPADIEQEVEAVVGVAGGVLVPGLPPGSHPGSSGGGIDVVLPSPHPLPHPPAGLVVRLSDSAGDGLVVRSSDSEEAAEDGVHRKKDKGWKGGPKHAGYAQGKIRSETTGYQYGYILLNMHPDALSLDAHCDRCGAKVNRKFREHRKYGAAHHQGRPMGSLIAWLRLRCTGQHKADYCDEKLPFSDRARARTWGEEQEHLRFLFQEERKKFPHEAHDEPKPLA